MVSKVNPLAITYVCILLLMPIGDTALIFFFRHKGSRERVLDRMSLFVLWFCASLGLFGAAFFKFIDVGRILTGGAFLVVSAIIITSVGILLRWVAMITLGRFFSPNVAIAECQPLITTGIYHYLRHPAYSGIILVFVGLGLALENWLSLLSAVALATVGVMNRVRIEEAALLESYGVPYEFYAAHTKRFVPFLL